MFENVRDKWCQIFRYRKLVEEVTSYTDSDWAGSKETRKSSSAGVVMLGDHALKAYTRKQKIIARSGAEAELHAADSGASETTGIVSLLRDSEIRDEASVCCSCESH